MARGTEAKEHVIEKIKESFGQDFVGIQDGKLYVLSPENGTKIQIAIGLTCPKNQIEMEFTNAFDMPIVKREEVIPQETEISEQEKKNLEDLLARLGL